MTLLSLTLMAVPEQAPGPKSDVPDAPQATREVQTEASLRATLRADPGNVAVLAQLADLLERTGRSHAALSLRRLAVAHANGPKQVEETRVALAVSLVEEGQSAEALPLLQGMLAGDPANAAAQFELGTVFARREEFAAAFEAFHRAALLRPADAEAQLSAAKALVTLLRYVEAEPYVEAAARLGAEAGEIHLLRGLIDGHTGREEQATAEFAEAVQMRPDDAEACLQLGEALREAGRPEEAVAQLERAEALRPSVTAEFQLAKAYRTMGKPEMEQQATEKLKAMEQQQADETKIAVATTRARAAEQANSMEEAASAYQTILAMRPEDSEVLYRLALVRGREGEAEKERALLERAVAGKTPPVGALVELGTMEGAAGDAGAAEREYRRALQADPQRADALSNLAVLTARKGDLTGAEALLRDALESDPMYAPAYRSLGLVEAAQGRSVEAERLLREGIAHRPDDAPLHVALGQLDLAEGRFADAAVELRTALRVAPKDLSFRLLLAQALAGGGDARGALEQTDVVLAESPGQAEAVSLRTKLCAGLRGQSGGEAESLCAGDPAKIANRPAGRQP